MFPRDNKIALSQTLVWFNLHITKPQSGGRDKIAYGGGKKYKLQNMDQSKSYQVCCQIVGDIILNLNINTTRRAGTHPSQK